MTAKIIAISTALSASLVLASPTYAGGGVRLGFGMPLGTFVATAAGGGSSSGAHLRKRPSKLARQHAARKAKPAQTVATARSTKPKPNPASDEKQQGVASTMPPHTVEERIESAAVELDQANASTPSTAIAASKAVDNKDEPKIAATEPAGCTRYIPSVSVTITVGCEK
jgi:hypothetical protein